MGIAAHRLPYIGCQAHMIPHHTMSWIFFVKCDRVNWALRAITSMIVLLLVKNIGAGGADCANELCDD
jgi:hypothetical protein